MAHFAWVLVHLAALMLGGPPVSSTTAPSAMRGPPGMAWIPAGEFTMGTDDAKAWSMEKPAHRVRISGFWMDTTEVTNAQFKRFVQATGYKTVAERTPDWEELKKQVPPSTPKPAADVLQPGSLVFTPPDHAVPLNDIRQWWTWTHGADWRHPEGPKSTIEGRENHPVVQVAWEDVEAYAKWAGKRLPTEAEWEYAARGGLEGKKFVWGNEEVTDERPRCNIWQGQFPWKNTLNDQYLRTAPVKTFQPNGYGLYDMDGNVWEWCSDFFRADEYTRSRTERKGQPLIDPQGPSDSWDPDEILANTPKRAIRGGSFLCHKNYCESYRPSARRGQTLDTSASHLGFRCAKSAMPQE